MATTKQATYKQFNGTDWDTIYFKTSAGQVGESSTLYFLRPATHKVNGKSFYGTTHQGITLYADDIKMDSSSTAQLISTEITHIKDTYFKIGETYNNDLTVNGYVLADEINSTGMIIEGGTALGDKYAAKNHTHDGLLSDTDRANLDALSEILVKDDEDEIVNRINDVFALFNGMDDTTTLISLLNNKAAKDHNHDTSYVKLSNVLGYEAFYNGTHGAGYEILDREYVQDSENVITAGALYEILKSFSHDGHTHSDYLLKTGGEISGDLQVNQRVRTDYFQANEANIYYLEMWDQSDTPTVVLDPDTATYTIEGKKISTTNIYYGAVDPTQDNNANNVQAGDIWLEYANGVG